jgi:glycosyltransferase involved in cell wall biosynthesis
MTAARPIRILHVIDQLVGGGAEVSLVEFLTSASTRTDPTHSLVVLNGQAESVDVARRLPIEAMISAPGRRPKWSDSAFVADAIDRFEPDIVHCALVRSTLATARALRGSDIPMLVTLTSVHYDVEDGTGSLKQRWGIKAAHTLHGMALRRPRVSFHAVSQGVADKAVEVFGLDPHHIQVVPRGRPDPLESLSADRSTTRASLGIPESSPVIITVAREHLVKNHVALLESAAILRQEFGDLRVVLVGGRSTGSEAIDSTLAQLDLGDSVLRLGHRTDVPDLLNAADVFVSTSRSEGLPGAIVEAIGVGLPVVAFDVPGVADVLGADHPGLIPFDDSTRLSDETGKILRDAATRDAIGVMGRARFEAGFEITGYVDRMTDIYRRLAHRADGMAAPKVAPEMRSNESRTTQR